MRKQRRAIASQRLFPAIASVEFKIRAHLACEEDPPPLVPHMDMDLHFAKVQQRWRYADDELAPGNGFGVEALAHDFTALPDGYETAPPDETAESMLDFFVIAGARQPSTDDPGGSIEPASEDDSALISDEATAEPAVLT